MPQQKVDGALIVEIDGDAEKLKSSLGKIAKVSAVSLATLTATIGGLSKSVLDVGISFESAFAGVKKTVNATEVEFSNLRQGILNLSKEIPVTANEIANIAEAAGQLGIKTENILEFTKVMANLGASTNLNSTEAATSLARLANVMQTNQKDFDRMGSSIVALGNNLATTESEIVDMAQNIAGAGKQVGLTEAEVLALSAALSSVGIEAAAGGTSISTLLIKIKKASVEGGKDLEEFAKVANMTSKDFKKAFDEDAGTAIQKFIEGLGNAEERGLDAIAMLDDAGLTDVRMTRALLNAAGASDVFSDAFEISNTAWEQNVALTKEAAQRYETTESKLKILQNTLTDTGITAFEKFKEPFKDSIEGGTEAIEKLNQELKTGNLGKSVDEIAKAFSELLKSTIEFATKALPPLLDGFSFLLRNAKPLTIVLGSLLVSIKGVLVAKKAAEAIKVLSTALTATNVASNIASKGITTLSTALGVGPLGLAVIAGTVAVGGLIALSTAIDDNRKRMHEAKYGTEKLKKELESLSTSYAEATKSSNEMFKTELAQVAMTEMYTNKVASLVDENGNLIGKKEDLVSAIDLLNESLGETLYWYDSETGKIMTQDGAVKDLTKSFEDLITTKKTEAFLSANQDKLTESFKLQSESLELMTATQRTNLDLAKKYDDQLKGSGITFDSLLKAYEKTLTAPVGDSTAMNAFGDMLDTVRSLGVATGDLKGDFEAFKFNDTSITSAAEQYKIATDSINQYVSAQEALAQGDMAKMSDFNLGFDITGAEVGIKELTAQLDTLKASQESNLVLFNKGIIPEEVVTATATKIDEINEKIAGLAKVDEQKTSEDALNIGSILGINIFTGLQEKETDIASVTELDQEKVAVDGMTTGTTFGDNIGIATNTGIQASTGTWIGTAQNAFNLSHVVLPVYIEYRDPGFSGGGRIGSGLGGASYDGGSLIDSTKRAFNGIFGNISANLTVNPSLIKSNAGNSGNTTISQHVEFNQPIESPATVTRALNKLSRKLQKVR